MQRASAVREPPSEDVLSAHDARAFEHAYDQHAAAVYRTALRFVGDRAQAQDIVQDVFMHLWRQPTRYDAARGTLGNYLRLMARSHALDSVREARVARRARERMKAIVLLDEGRSEDRPPVACELRGEQRVVLRAIALLPAPQRQAIVLAYWGGLTADQIATRLELPVGTVKSRLRLGLRHLRGRCEAQLGEHPRLAA
jgi:RNA polymerase sigma-70 factor (ECF subfamily)